MEGAVPSAPSILAAVLFLICTACTSSKQGSETVRIGIIASLTGGAADQGKNWLDGATLAADELAAQGTPIRLIVEDDATQPARVASAFLKLAKVDRVYGIIGGTWDFLAETAYPLARQHRVPFLTPSNPVEVIPESESQNPWIFTNSVSLAASKDAARQLFKALGVHSVGLLIPNISYGHHNAAMMDQLVAELGLKVTVREEFAMEGYPDNLKVAALKFRTNTPDIIFVVLDANGIDLFTDELQRMRLSPAMLCTQHLGEAFVLGRDSSKFTKAYGIYPKVQDVTFDQRFQAKFGRPPKVLAAEGYDAVMFMAHAATSRISLGDPAATFVYAGAMGEYRLSGSSRQLVQSRATIMTTVNGRFEEFPL